MNQSKTLSAQKADTISTVQNWLSLENSFISSLLESKITNRQTLLLFNCLTAFSALILLCSSLIGAIITFFWFVLSLYLAKKGGLR